MRAVLAVAVVLAMTGGAVAGSPCAPENMPPMSAREKPIDPYTVTYVATAKVQRWCGRGQNVMQILGCVGSRPGKSGVFHIIIDDALSATDAACVLIYERAHLPPNYWVDADRESRGAGLSVEAWEAGNN